MPPTVSGPINTTVARTVTKSSAPCLSGARGLKSELFAGVSAEPMAFPPVGESTSISINAAGGNPVRSPLQQVCRFRLQLRQLILWLCPMFRSGKVALVGRANVGKSTFLNTALGEPLAAVSSHPQTTRDALLAVVTRDWAEFALVDSPGLHKPHNELGRRMNLSAIEAVRQADFALVFIDVSRLAKEARERRQRQGSPNTPAIAEEIRVIESIPSGIPWAIVLNKIDRLKDKSLLLPLLSDLSQRFPERSVIPISSLDRTDVDRALEAVAPSLPERPARYCSDTLTDRPVRYFAAEYIREQVMRSTRGELPFAVAVTIDEFSELESPVVIQATISVEKDGQRIILIGHQGRQIRDISILARQRIEHLLQKKVHLRMFVRTCKHWKDNQNLLAELGYSHSGPAAVKPLALRPGGA
jgi:GTPase